MPPLRWGLRRDAAKSSRREDDETAALVAQIKAGERHLFERLYARYFDRVYGYLKVMLQDCHEAEDAAQQTFIQVLQALPQYQQRKAPFRAWLFRIARNEGLMRLRKRGRVDVSDPEVVERCINGSAETRGVDPAVRWQQGFGELIAPLPEAQQQVLMLRYVLDMTPQEIATVIGRSHGAVRKLQHRAIRALEAQLEGDDRVPRAARRSRAPMLVRLRRAHVVRSRRFALMAPAAGRGPGFTPIQAFQRAAGFAPVLGRQPYR